MPKLDRTCIVHEGYMWKSPPLEKSFIARWKRRWFVLYDTFEKVQEGEQRELELLYYESENENGELKAEDAIGEFALVCFIFLKFGSMNMVNTGKVIHLFYLTIHLKLKNCIF